MTEQERQLQEIVVLLTKRSEGGTPVRKLAIERKLAEYPKSLVVKAAKGMGGRRDEPKSLDEEEDFVLLWQEQMLSARSELTAVIESQKTLSTALQRLYGKVPELVQDLGDECLEEVSENIVFVSGVLEKVKDAEKELAELRSKFKDWRRWKEEGTAFGGEALKEKSDGLAKYADTVLPELMKTMKEADASAERIQTDIVERMTQTAQASISRLQMESEEGWGGTYASVKRYSEVLVGGLGSFLSTWTGGLVSKSKVGLLNTAVSSLVSLTKEVHVGRNVSTDPSNLSDLIDQLGPLGVYRANLIKYKDWCGAGMDLGGLAGLIPVPFVADWLAFGFERVKGVLDGYLDGQLDWIAKKDDQMKEAYEQLQSTNQVTQEALDRIRMKLDEDLSQKWSQLGEQGKKFKEDWIKTVTEIGNQALEKGMGDDGKLDRNNTKDGAIESVGWKALDFATSTIARIASDLFPPERPAAIFGAEVNDLISTMDLDKTSEFTEQEKEQLLALSQ